MFSLLFWSKTPYFVDILSFPYRILSSFFQIIISLNLIHFTYLQICYFYYFPAIYTPFYPSYLCYFSVCVYLFTQFVEALRYRPDNHGFFPRWGFWNFSLISSFRPHFGPWNDSASNRNEYQESFLGVKAAGAYGWQPCHLHVPIF